MNMLRKKSKKKWVKGQLLGFGGVLILLVLPLKVEANQKGSTELEKPKADQVEAFEQFAKRSLELKRLNIGSPSQSTYSGPAGPKGRGADKKSKITFSKKK